MYERIDGHTIHLEGKEMSFHEKIKKRNDELKTLARTGRFDSLDLAKRFKLKRNRIYTILGTEKINILHIQTSRKYANFALLSSLGLSQGAISKICNTTQGYVSARLQKGPKVEGVQPDIFTIKLNDSLKTLKGEILPNESKYELIAIPNTDNVILRSSSKLHIVKRDDLAQTDFCIYPLEGDNNGK